MIKYYTREFKNNLKDNYALISEWLNYFEEKREGRPHVDYGITIVNNVVVGNSIVVTIIVHGNTKDKESND